MEVQFLSKINEHVFRLKKLYYETKLVYWFRCNWNPNSYRMLSLLKKGVIKIKQVKPVGQVSGLEAGSAGNYD